MMDKIIKEDENFTWFETELGIGYVASKKAFFHLQPESSKREDTKVYKETLPDCLNGHDPTTL